MNFKDEMLSNFRDKTTVTTEEQEKRREELFNKALECIRMIKQSFVRAAQQGEYQEVNGKKVLALDERKQHQIINILVRTRQMHIR